jgi:hypothetical protein
VPGSRLRINIPASVWVVRTILVTSHTASGAGGSDLPHRICPIAKILLLDCRSIICDQFNNRRIYRSLRLLATLHRISDSEREVTGVKLMAIITAMVIALATPAFADISDCESMHRRLADVLGSRAQADAAYDKLMKEANTNGQPIDSVVDLFIAVCTVSDECNP